MAVEEDEEIRGSGDEGKKEDLSAGASAKEDERYYVPCPNRKNQARIPVTLCERCEYGSDDFTRVDPCWYPSSKRKRKR
jgi:hypothetical protein